MIDEMIFNKETIKKITDQIKKLKEFFAKLKMKIKNASTKTEFEMVIKIVSDMEKLTDLKLLTDKSADLEKEYIKFTNKNFNLYDMLVIYIDCLYVKKIKSHFNYYVFYFSLN